MIPVATRAVCGGLGTALSRQTVVGSIETNHDVGGKAKPPGQSNVAVAACARVSNMTGIYGRSSLLRRDDIVLSVTVCAQWRISVPGGERLAMDALAVLAYNLVMAHPARVRDCLPELQRRWPQHLVRAAVANPAVGGGVTFLASLPMHAQVFIPCHLLVALSACGLWNIGRVREVLMAKMAGGALHAGVRTALDLRGLVVVAGGTVSLRLRQGHQRKGKPQHRQPQQHPGSTAHCNRHSQPPFLAREPATTIFVMALLEKIDYISNCLR